MGTLEELKVMNDGRSAAFVSGLTDGRSARARDEVLSPYQHVGMDDYANGFRTGFFNRVVPPRAAGAVTHRAMGE
jgi:hypothetical protein